MIITCLLMMWKILTTQVKEEIYYSLPQKGCCIGSRGTAVLLYIDQHVLNDSKTRRKNFAMAWIDNKNAYDRVLQNWIIHCLKM